jgi:hypothetical protein
MSLRHQLRKTLGELQEAQRLARADYEDLGTGQIADEPGQQILCKLILAQEFVEDCLAVLDAEAPL